MWEFMRSAKSSTELRYNGEAMPRRLLVAVSEGTGKLAEGAAAAGASTGPHSLPVVPSSEQLSNLAARSAFESVEDIPGLLQTQSEAGTCSSAGMSDLRSNSVSVVRTSPNLALFSPASSKGGLLNSASTGSPSITKRLSRLLSATVNFRDVSFVTREDPAENAEADVTVAAPGGGGAGTIEYATLSTGVQKNRLIIIMVGLPGRGKTFLCNKLMRYLNWLGHSTRHFNVGQYRRKQKSGPGEVQDAQFFDHTNEAGREARHRALMAALEDMMRWLDSDSGQVAIFDATNSTEERRRLLRQQFHGRWQYLFIETICNDEEVLQQNYLNKMRYSPDYAGMGTMQALADFKARIRKYEEVYEQITDRSYHFIKLIDMVTGRGHMDLNRISGYIPGKIVFFLMQVCKAGLSTVRKLWLTRHGQSEYNRKHLLGGNSSISEDGEKYAELLPGALLSRLPQAEEQVSLSVWTSTLKRTIQTARHLPFPKLQWKALDEIDAGACDGMTYEDIARDMPEEFAARKKDKLRYRYPAGESYLDVVQRLEPVITEMEREREYVCIVSHQAVLRVIYGYFMGVPLEQIPSLEIPLHTLIELTPLPDGTMHEQRFRVDTARGPEQFAALSAGQFAEDVAAALTAGALNEMSGITNSDTDTLLKVGSPVDSSLANNHNHTAGTASGASCSTSTSSLSPQGGDQRSSPIRQSVGNNLAATDSMMIAPAATDAAALGLADSSSSTQLAAQGELAA